MAKVKIIAHCLLVVVMSLLINESGKAMATIEDEACASEDWVECGKSIGNSIYYADSWRKDGTVSFLGHKCVGRINSRFFAFRWVWDGKFECPTIMDAVAGRSTTQDSRALALRTAIQKFAIKNIKLPAFARLYSKSDDYNPALYEGSQ